MPSRRVPLVIPPGIVKSDDPYLIQGRYIACDKVRFRQGVPEKIGGWSRWNAGAGNLFSGVCRALHQWIDFAQNKWLAVGCHWRLHVYDSLATEYDITPLDRSGTSLLEIHEEPATDEVRVQHIAHGLIVGQRIFFSECQPLLPNSHVFDGFHTVRTVIDGNNYEFANPYGLQLPGPVTSNPDHLVNWSYELDPGEERTTTAGGWGVGTWGSGTWGTEHTSSTLAVYPRTWSFDNYGQYLVGLPSGQHHPYIWQLSTSTLPVKITNAPRGEYVFVTSERIVVVLGINGDLMRMAWSDDDDYTDWTPTAANTASTRTLTTGSRLVAGTRLVQQVNLIWSDTALYVMQWLGSNFVYSTRVVAKNCGLAGPKAFAVNDGKAFWMSGFGFYMFSGAVQKIPNSGDIERYVFNAINPLDLCKAVCVYNPKFNEVMWSIPSTLSGVPDDPGNLEPDAYVLVNLTDYSWATGTLARTAWTAAQSIGGEMFSADTAGIIYTHETGVNDNGSSMPWHLESAYIDLENGNKSLNLSGYVPNFERQTGSVTALFTSLDNPEDAASLDTATDTIAVNQAISDLRMCGRQMKIKLSGTGVGCDFRLGKQKVEIDDAGTRR